jgi:hypothetical protein
MENVPNEGRVSAYSWIDNFCCSCQYPGIKIITSHVVFLTVQ